MWIVVRAAGVNPLDWKIRSGATAEMRPVRFPKVPGIDVAGVVDRVGEGVVGFASGDEVLGKAADGSYAERALVRDDAITAAVPWEIAAALPVASAHRYSETGHVRGKLVLVPDRSSF